MLRAYARKVRLDDSEYRANDLGDQEPRQLLTLAACACARLVLELDLEGHEHDPWALQQGEAWARGEMALEDLKSRLHRLWENIAPATTISVITALDGAIESAVHVLQDAPRVALYPQQSAKVSSDVADAFAYAAAHLANDGGATATRVGNETRARCADRIRTIIPYPHFSPTKLKLQTPKRVQLFVKEAFATPQPFEGLLVAADLAFESGAKDAGEFLSKMGHLLQAGDLTGNAARFLSE
jgi:hypothetical protein